MEVLVIKDTTISKARFLTATLRYLFILRVPLLVGSFIFALPIFAHLGSGNSMLRNLFTLHGWQLFFASAMIAMTSWSIRLAWRSILLYAPKRFEVPDIRRNKWYPNLRQYCCFVWIIITLPTVIALVYNAEYENIWLPLVIVLVGASLSAAVLLIVPIQASKRFNKPADWYLDNDSRLARFFNTPEIQTTTVKESGPEPLSFLKPILRNGYVHNGNWLPGHFIFTIILTGLAVYFVPAGFIFRPGFVTVAALVSLFALLMITNFFLTGLTFFLDRFRVPLLFSISAVWIILYSIQDVDHYFEVSPNNNSEAITQELAIKNRLEKLPSGKQGKTAVVVAASGGGIQSAMWTTQVLAGLHELYGNDFADSILAISSVSGGSVGTLFYLDRFQLDPKERANAVKASGANSLREVGWGIIYPDLARLVIPTAHWLLPEYVDRGWALERAWQNRLVQKQKSFADWAKEIGDGKLPIAVFNCTIVETGKRLLLTPVKIDPAKMKNTVDFHGLYKNMNINAVTAARLSATFPYISPVARAKVSSTKDSSSKENEETDKENLELTGESTYHIADGAYYDNYGVLTLVEWLYDAFERKALNGVDNILLVQIFLEKNEKNKPKSKSGWESAAFAPFATVLNVQKTTQRSRNDMELKLLKSYINANSRYGSSKSPSITTVDFLFTGKEVMSWKLTRKEQKKINDQWCNPIIDNDKKELGKIDKYFDRQTLTTESFCGGQVLNAQSTGNTYSRLDNQN